MFTGIVTAIGRLAGIEMLAGGERRVTVSFPEDWGEGLREGDSVAVAGVCLTLVSCAESHFSADVSRETLARTTLGILRTGDAVNLERALALGAPLGGHLLTGHVDAIGRVLAVEAEAASQRWRFSLPPEIAPLVAVKGSIAVDGVSLTVNAVDAESFDVRLIPHTLGATTFRFRRPGDAVNLEADLIARYVARFLGAAGAKMPPVECGTNR
ncbi:MAG: riboflavin synthase subunit alpha [Lysobacterales bacterium]|jgi:riboflavin synthase|nr:MAG: riboflavin synthase subunit alpha [Xanthomonadales bacterium]